MLGGSGNVSAFTVTPGASIPFDGPSLRIDSRTAVTDTTSANCPTYRRTHSQEHQCRAIGGANIPLLRKETPHAKRMAAFGAALLDNGSSAHLGIRGEAAHAPIASGKPCGARSHVVWQHVAPPVGALGSRPQGEFFEGRDLSAERGAPVQCGREPVKLESHRHQRSTP